MNEYSNLNKKFFQRNSFFFVVLYRKYFSVKVFFLDDEKMKIEKIYFEIPVIILINTLP